MTEGIFDITTGRKVAKSKDNGEMILIDLELDPTEKIKEYKRKRRQNEIQKPSRDTED